LRDIDAQRAALEILTVEVLERLLSALGGRHLDEAETTGLTGHPVEHQCNLADLAAGREELRDEVFSSVIREVANVQTIRHFGLFSLAASKKRQTPTSRTEGEVVIALNETSRVGVARDV
jgi:hypothetical protein